MTRNSPESGAPGVRTRCSCPSLVSSGAFVPVAIRRGRFCWPSELRRVSASGFLIGKSYGRSRSGCEFFSGSIGVSWVGSTAQRGRRSWMYIGSYSDAMTFSPARLPVFRRSATSSPRKAKRHGTRMFVIATDGAYRLDGTSICLPPMDTKRLLSVWQRKVFDMFLGEGKIDQELVAGSHGLDRAKSRPDCPVTWPKGRKIGELGRKGSRKPVRGVSVLGLESLSFECFRSVAVSRSIWPVPASNGC